MMNQKPAPDKSNLKGQLQTVANGGALDTKKPKTWKDFFEERKGEIAQVLPSVMKQAGAVDRMIRLAMTVGKRKPELLSCTPESVIGSLLECSALGLEPETPLKQAYLIPFNNKGRKECQLVVDYRGYIDLAYRSGNILSIRADVVYSQDTFEYALGSEEYIKHVPATNYDKSLQNEITHAYAYAKMKGGAFSFLVWPIEKVREHAKRFSPSYKSETSPWQTDFPKMAMKTMIRQLTDYLPRSAENMLFRAASNDEKPITDPFNYDFDNGIQNTNHNVSDITNESEVL